MINALKLAHKKLAEVKMVVNGAGAAAIAVTKFLLSAGAKDIILCDSKGMVYEGRPENMNSAKEEMAQITNRGKLRGTLAEALVGADVFLGLSGPNLVNRDMVKKMAPDPIIFAMANPTPEILPEEAKAGGARIIATGRSDFPNQVTIAWASRPSLKEPSKYEPKRSMKR
jgi:malate dehydrogenase (oxaloacetate-decarboxylating)